MWLLEKVATLILYTYDNKNGAIITMTPFKHN